MQEIQKLNLASWSISRNPWVLVNDPVSAFTFHCEDVIWKCEEAKRTAFELENVYLFECRKVKRGAIIKLADPSLSTLLEFVVEHFTEL